MLHIRVMEHGVEHHADDASDHEQQKALPDRADTPRAYGPGLRLARQWIGPVVCHSRLDHLLLAPVHSARPCVLADGEVYRLQMLAIPYGLNPGWRLDGRQLSAWGEWNPAFPTAEIAENLAKLPFGHDQLNPPSRPIRARP
jgi:hypothetical protein